MDGEIRFVGDLHRMQLQPGDALVLTVKNKLSEAEHARITKRMEQVFPEVRVIIADAGTTVEIIRKAKAS